MSNPNTSPKKSLFTNVSAKQFFIAAIIFFALDIFIAMVTESNRPTTQIGAILPGLLMGVLGWIAIICLIAGIVKWFKSRKK